MVFLYREISSWLRGAMNLLSLPMRMAFIISLTSSLSFGRPVIGLVTDFGLKNEAVGLCKGAIARINPDALVIDITHDIESFSIHHASIVLKRTTVFPRGSVFVCVVDPGVGTHRRAIALETKAGYTYVGPDNGVFSTVATEQGIAKAIEIDPALVNPNWHAGTFDGRDLFSPAAAVIATSGTLESAGKSIDPATLVRVEIPAAWWDADKKELHGEYLRTDEPYGNVWTNITSDDLTSAGIEAGHDMIVRVGDKTIELPYKLTFGHVAKGKPLGYLNSDGTFGLAINLGNFAKTYGAHEGTTVTVKLKQ